MEGGTVGINGSGLVLTKEQRQGPGSLQEKCPAGIEGLVEGKRKALVGSRLRNHFVKDSECCLFKTLSLLSWQSTQDSWHRGPNTRAWSLLWVGINC